MEIRRRLLIRETVLSEGELAAIRPVTRVAACAVIRNLRALRRVSRLGQIFQGDGIGCAVRSIPCPQGTHTPARQSTHPQPRLARRGAF